MCFNKSSFHRLGPTKKLFYESKFRPKHSGQPDMEGGPRHKATWYPTRGKIAGKVPAKMYNSQP